MPSFFSTNQNSTTIKYLFSHQLRDVFEAKNRKIYVGAVDFSLAHVNLFKQKNNKYNITRLFY